MKINELEASLFKMERGRKKPLVQTVRVRYTPLTCSRQFNFFRSGFVVFQKEFFKRKKKKKVGDGIHSLPLRRSDIWNKEAGYVSTSVWDRQTDRGWALPAKSTAHVGWGHSGMTHSCTHRKTETRTHTKCNVFARQTSLKASTVPGLRCPAAQACGETLNRNMETEERAESLARFFLLGFFPRLRWKCCWWDCPACHRRRVCVGSLCYYLPCRQPARLNKASSFLFSFLFFQSVSWALLCEVVHFYALFKRLCKYLSIHLVSVNNASQTNKHHLRKHHGSVKGKWSRRCHLPSSSW